MARKLSLASPAWLAKKHLLTAAIFAFIAVITVFGLARSTSAEHTTASNGIYDLFVDHEGTDIGTYTAGTGSSHPVTINLGSRQNVLYGGAAGSAGTSYTTIRSYTSNTDYVQRGASSSFTVVELSPFATSTVELGGSGFQTTYVLPGPGAAGQPSTPDQLEITQTWRVNGSTLNDSVIELTTTVQNTGSSDVAIGIRYEWDIQMSCDDGPTFTPVDAAGNPIGSTLTTEETFASPTFPAYRIEDNDCVGSPLFAVFGTAGASGLTPPPSPPELLMYTAWPSASSSAFDYTTDPTNSSPDSDSAVLYFYGATPNTAIVLGSGESVTVTAELFAGQAGEPPPVFATPTPTPTPTPTVVVPTDTPAPATDTPTPEPTATVGALPSTGAGTDDRGADGSGWPWTIAVLAGLSTLAAAGYGIIRARRRTIR
jgi:hypothetical protein